MPIYSPTGFLDITNATLRTSNVEAENLLMTGGNIYVTSELETDATVLNLENVTRKGNVSSNTIEITNATTGIVATGNVHALKFIGSGEYLTGIGPSAITGTFSQWSDGTNGDVYIASNVGIANAHTLTSNTLQVGGNLYVRDTGSNVLTVNGNVVANYFEGDGSKLSGIVTDLQGVTDNGNVTTNVVQFSNVTTGLVTTANIEVGGDLKIDGLTAGTVPYVAADKFLKDSFITTTGDTTVITSNLDVTGNIFMRGDKFIVNSESKLINDAIVGIANNNTVSTTDKGIIMQNTAGNVAIIHHGTGDGFADQLTFGYTDDPLDTVTVTNDLTKELTVNVLGNVITQNNLSVGGTLKINNITAAAQHSLQAVTNVGNVTSNTVQFSNAITSLTASSNIVVTGNVSAGHDTNTTSYFGRAAVGYMGTSDQASFAHVDHNDPTRYAIKQTAAGPTYINTPAAGHIRFTVNDGSTGAEKMRITSAGKVGVGVTSPDATLHVVGNAYVSSNLTVSGNVEVGTANLFVDTVNSRIGIGTVRPASTLNVQGDGAFLHAGSGTPHNSNDITLRLGGLNSSGNIIQSKCAIIVTPNTSYGGEADYGRNAVHFCTRNTQDNTNADITNAKISILPNGNVGFSHPNPDKRIHVRTFSNSILAGLDHVTTSGSSGNDEYVGLGLGVTGDGQANRIFKGGIFFERKGGNTGRGDLLFCIENTQDNTTEVSPANAIMRITRNSDVGITGNLSVSGNATFDTDTLFVDSTNNRVGVGTTSPDNALHIRNAIPAVLLDDSDDDTKVRITGGAGGDLYVDSNWGGSGNTGDIIFREASSEKMRITSAGKVGVGVNSPDATLHVVGNAYVSSDLIVSSDVRGGYDTNTTSYFGRAAVGYCGHGDAMSISHIDSNDTGGYALLQEANGGTILNSASGQAVRLRQGNVDKLTIDSSGNVGIGASSPQQNLHVHESGSGQVVIAVTNDTTGGGNNDGIHFGIDSSEQGFVWHKQNTALLFATNNAERMRINNVGNVGINKTNPGYILDVHSDDAIHIEQAGNTTFETKVHGGALFIRNPSTSSGYEHFIINNHATGNHTTSYIQFRRGNTGNGSAIGTISGNGSTISYGGQSDYRVKENIVPMPISGLDTINNLQPKRFNFIGYPDDIYDGFIAHELQEHIPMAVTGVKDEMRGRGNVVKIDDESIIVKEDVSEPDSLEEGTKWVKLSEEPVYQNVDLSKIVTYLVKAVQELSEENQTLKTRLDALENAS